MMLKEILNEAAIEKEMKATSKDEAIEELVSLLCNAYGLKNKKKIVKCIEEREKLGSTGMGQNIAIPHCKLDGLEKIFLGIGVSKEGLDFRALDGEPVHIFFILVAPSSGAGVHLKVLARISKLLRDEYFCRSIRNSTSVENIYKMVITDDEKIQR